MEAFPDRFNIALVGRWNPSIFSPEWIKQHICTSDQSEVTYAVPINNPEAPPLISFEGVRLYPGTQRLEIRPDNSNIEELVKCAFYIDRIVNLLPHTPLMAIGVNVSFIEREEIEKIVNQINLTDSANIDGQIYRLSNSIVSRSYALENEIILNLKLEYDSDKAVIDFNFHSDISAHEKVIKILSEDNIRSRYDQSVSFVKTVYDLSLD